MKGTPEAPACPICESTEFGDYRNRKRSRCTNCGSKERQRFMALALARAELEAPGPVFHFAPESAIADVLLESFGELYTPADYEPERYSWSKVPVQPVDLSDVPRHFPPDSVGGFVHSHVLEHIPGSFERVIADMNASIRPGGFHVFQVPIITGWYREDMDPNLGDEERLRLFFQEDHLRMFGDADFEDRVLRLFPGFEQLQLTDFFTRDDMVACAIPRNALTRFTGHTPFIFVKR